VDWGRERGRDPGLYYLWGFLREFDLRTGLNRELFAGRLSPALDARPYTRVQAMNDQPRQAGAELTGKDWM
jgi:hypothetical protein